LQVSCTHYLAGRWYLRRVGLIIDSHVMLRRKYSASLE
jgi:hypothetical protein